MKKVKPEMIMSALCIAVMAVTGCGNESSKVSEGESTTEWWEVDRENMDEEETTSSEEETTTTTESVSETTSEATEATTEGSSEDDTSESGAENESSGSGSSGSAESLQETEDTEEAIIDILINGEKNIPNYDAITSVTVNGYEDDNIKVGGSSKLDTFIKCTGLQMNDKLHYNPDDDNDDVFWYGQGYSSKSKEDCVYIEAVPITESTMIPTDIDTSQRDGYYRIRSLYVSAEDIGDLEVKFGAVQIGMERTTVESYHASEGGETCGYTYYANDYGALLLSYNDDDLVDEMYLFVDYEDYLKIKYAVQ